MKKNEILLSSENVDTLRFDLCDIDLSEGTKLETDLNNHTREFHEISLEGIFEEIKLIFKTIKKILPQWKYELDFNEEEKFLNEVKEVDFKFLRLVCVESGSRPLSSFYQPQNPEALYQLIHCLLIIFHDEYLNLNWIDVSRLTTMMHKSTSIGEKHGMFEGLKFNGCISQWDVSNVRNMSSMFKNSDFNGDISRWDVRRVSDMSHMFEHCLFQAGIGHWDVSNCRDMSHMFYYNVCFCDDISHWDVSKVRDMSCMFCCSKFNGDISKWDVSCCKNMESMFENSKFNQDLSQWDTRNCNNMCAMFAGSVFTGDISQWNTKQVKTFSNMFYESKFNGDLSQWDINNVKYMGCMFAYSVFDHDISQWRIKPSTDISGMFNFSKIRKEYIPQVLRKIY